MFLRAYAFFDWRNEHERHGIYRNIERKAKCLRLFANKTCKGTAYQQAKSEWNRKRKDKSHEIPLPKITPHTLRHTFCTRLAQKKMNPKNLQYIMGHSSITITLDLYAHASETGANVEMRSLIAWFTTKCTTIESKDIRDKVQLHGVSVKREKPPNPYNRDILTVQEIIKRYEKIYAVFIFKNNQFLTRNVSHIILSVSFLSLSHKRFCKFL